jgi:ATP-dependent DNA helicase HFM1/MER3
MPRPLHQPRAAAAAAKPSSTTETKTAAAVAGLSSFTTQTTTAAATALSPVDVPQAPRVPTADEEPTLSRFGIDQPLLPVQAKCFEVAFRSDKNLLVCAPTGSGKTGVFKLAMARLLSRRRNPALQPAGSILYFAPSKALVNEMVRNLGAQLGSAGFGVGELTSDIKGMDLQRAVGLPVVCCTPEKYDAFSRVWQEGSHFATQLVLIDEVHLLNDERGSALESCVARLKMRLPGARFIAASATVTNPQHVADWLGACEQRVFGEEFRPVPLTTVVKGYPARGNPFVFAAGLNRCLREVILAHNNGRPSLVFCATRRECSVAAKELKRCRFTRDYAHRQRLHEGAKTIEDDELRVCITESAVAFHSAGLSVHDRQLVEDLYAKLDIAVLCTTSTLSQGVNLPAHLVVVKGTCVELLSTIKLPPSFPHAFSWAHCLMNNSPTPVGAGLHCLHPLSPLYG